MSSSVERRCRMPKECLLRYWVVLGWRYEKTIGAVFKTPCGCWLYGILPTQYIGVYNSLYYSNSLYIKYTTQWFLLLVYNDPTEESMFHWDKHLRTDAAPSSRRVQARLATLEGTPVRVTVTAPWNIGLFGEGLLQAMHPNDHMFILMIWCILIIIVILIIVIVYYWHSFGIIHDLIIFHAMWTPGCISQACLMNRGGSLKQEFACLLKWHSPKEAAVWVYQSGIDDKEYSQELSLPGKIHP